MFFKKIENEKKKETRKRSETFKKNVDMQLADDPPSLLPRVAVTLGACKCTRVAACAVAYQVVDMQLARNPLPA